VPSPSDPTAQLAIRGLRKRFGTRTVLDGVDLDAEAGTIVLLAGSNGSGKTTLLRCIAGLARAEGTVTLGGLRLGVTGAGHPDVGYLPQTPGMPTWATVAEVLTLFARLRGCRPDSIDLPNGFLPPLDQPVGQLSGGQRQRVAFAVALLGAPSLLLLDEPAANLDDEGRAALVAVLEKLRDAGTCVLVAAPSPGDLNGLPDRTVRLVEGVLADDTALRLVGPTGTRTPPATPPPPAAGRSDADARGTEEVPA
jgi:ABC-2 type transport system ATP-binding protein